MKLKRFLIAVVLLVSLFPFLSSSAYQSPQEIAANGMAFEFVAQIDQSDFDLVISGYLTHINGVDPMTLFLPETSPIERGEGAAYFTFQAVGTIYARSVLQPIFNTNANMTMTVYYNETPAATFEDTTTFAQGVPIAVYTVRLQNMLNVQAPDVAIVLSSGESVQTESTPFTFNGGEVQFGHAGMNLSFNAFGQGFRKSLTPLVVQLITAGNSVVAND